MTYSTEVSHLADLARSYAGHRLGTSLGVEVATSI